MFLKAFPVFISFIFLSAFCKAADEIIPTGSYLMNLGVQPQTAENGLKPYGLVYELLSTYHVPVKWLIKPGKGKDEEDFTAEGTEFRGGSFVVLSEYRTNEVNGTISEWERRGVNGKTSTSDLTLPVYATLTYAPRWTIHDEAASDLNGQQVATLVLPFFQNAGIPATAYGEDSKNWKTPSELTGCDDIFVLPHSDPTWPQHNNLIAWNRNSKGFIWASCHAVSVLENTTSPNETSRMNFLSTTGLSDYGTHFQTGAPPPYKYSYHDDPVMQFMGDMDAAANTGSERVYLPAFGSTWRSNVKVTIEASPLPSIFSDLTDGPATIMAYGRGFNNENSGQVMYQSGHFHNANPPRPEHVAVQRAFFNFSFLSVIDKQKNLSGIVKGPSIVNPGETYSFTLATDDDLSGYQVSWAASSGQVIAGLNPKEIQYVGSRDRDAEKILISAILKDDCGREFFFTKTLAITCRPDKNFEVEILGDSIMLSGLPNTATAKVNRDLKHLQFKWSASSGQILPSDTSKQIQFVPDLNLGIKNAELTLSVIDTCGWDYVYVKKVTIDHCKPDKTIDFSIISSDSLDLGFRNKLDMTGNRDWNKFTYEWTAIGGRFIPDNKRKDPQFIPDLTETAASVTIGLRITDTCGFAYDTVKVIPIDLLKGPVKVPKLVSANEDGLGYDFLFIRNIENFPNNELNIYNRWGGIVYEAKNYDNMSKTFRGLSKSGEPLPEGVYYYVLNLKQDTGDSLNASPPQFVEGYFVLQR